MNTTAAQNIPFRVALQNELLNRCKKNPGYSLRSYARVLNISPSSLSRILRGERKISPEMRSRLGKRLGFAPHQLEQFDLSAPQTTLPEKAGTTAPDYRQLALDGFQVVSDWYHFAILELTRTSGFKPKASWVAKRLGLTVSEVHAAVERLKRLDLLSVEDDGRWTSHAENITNINADMRDAAYRKLQRQLLELAIHALEETPIERRNQTAMTMAASSRKLPGAIEIIKKFRRELCAFLEDDNERDQVYQLSISLFPLTTEEKKPKTIGEEA